MTGSGQLGSGVKGGQSDIPVQVNGVGGAVALAVGSDHNCAVTSSDMRCWGENVLGELGHGNTDETTAAVRVHKLTAGAVIASAAGSSHSCVIVEGGGVRCWGNNVYG